MDCSQASNKRCLLMTPSMNKCLMSSASIQTTQLSALKRIGTTTLLQLTICSSKGLNVKTSPLPMLQRMLLAVQIAELSKWQQLKLQKQLNQVHILQQWMPTCKKRIPHREQTRLSNKKDNQGMLSGRKGRGKAATALLIQSNNRKLIRKEALVPIITPIRIQIRYSQLMVDLKRQI